MNTNFVAALLGVSPSTIKRWVKQLELPMDRNDRGHYSFTEEDLELLKKIHVQIQNGAILQDITLLPEKKMRKATVIHAPQQDQLLERLSGLEDKLSQKADYVASYQLLQHRREIEELESQVNDLTGRLEKLEAQLSAAASKRKEETVIHLQNSYTKKPKKRKFMNMLFGF